MKQVPLSDVFSSAIGTGLSRDPFGTRSGPAATYPLDIQLGARMVFASDRGIARDWMKGLLLVTRQ